MRKLARSALGCMAANLGAMTGHCYGNEVTHSFWLTGRAAMFAAA